MFRLATAFAVLFIGIAVVFFRNDIIDFFIEGDDDPWYLEAGRYEGTWLFAGDPKELDPFAPGLERIEFRIEDSPPGSWRDENPPPRTGLLTMAGTSSKRGACIVEGREYSFRLLPGEARHVTGWIQLDERPHFLTGRAYGDGFGMDLEAARRPANDWLFLWFGRNGDGSSYGFAFSRVE